jgi:hypothetical protein
MSMNKHSKSTDVTKVNPFDTLYLFGNETTDGSRRLIFRDTGGGSTNHIEKRTLGAWQNAELEVGTNTLFLGESLGLTTVGQHLASEKSDRDNRYIFARAQFPDTGTEELKILEADAGVTRAIIQPDDSGEFTGTYFASTIVSPFNVLQSRVYLKIGATPATKPVRVVVREGTDANAPINWDFNYPASSFGPADTEIDIELQGLLESTTGTSYFVEYISDEDFSLKTNAAGTVEWIAFDLNFFHHNDVLITKEWTAGDPTAVGDWFIDHNSRRIYDATQAGTKSAAFTDELESWYPLISVRSYDRVLSDITAGTVFDQVGNFVISGNSQTL